MRFQFPIHPQGTLIVPEVLTDVLKATAAIAETRPMDGRLAAGRRALVVVGCSVAIHAREVLGAMQAVPGLEVGRPTAVMEMIDAGRLKHLCFRSVMALKAVECR